ncbi:hypothetical protein [Streptomyces sp. Ac-502]
MAEWTNSRYAELVRSYRAAEEEGHADVPLRGFVIPDTASGQPE